MLKKIRKQLKSLVRKKLGLPEKKPKAQYGNDPWDDISKLSNALKRPIHTVFDVGAHTGSLSSEILTRYEDANLYAFEPQHSSFVKLSQNINTTRFHPYEMAVGEQSGVATFYEYGHESTINSLVPNAPYAHRFERQSKTREVAVISIDDFCLKNGVSKITVLKIDTEGHDLAVLKGATAMLQKGAIDFILFEFNDFRTNSEASGGSLLDIGSHICEFGYSFIATYTDYIVTKGELFVVANALAVRR